MYKKHGQQGQTIIEAVVATFMIVVALGATLSLAVIAIRTARDSRDKVVATNLAREAVEAVRALRDTNWLHGDMASNTGAGTGNEWDQGFGNSTCLIVDPVVGGGVLTYLPYSDPNDSSIPCSPIQLYRSDSTQLYSSSITGVKTIFSRSIEHVSCTTGLPANPDCLVGLDTGKSNDEQILKVTVSWNDGAGNQSVTVIDHLTNWKSGVAQP